ncbi:MAG: peptidoglycan bridge formation glycyltransferase FemA/FemB family protein [Candidatus Hydrothermales bacterium]
MSYFKKFTLKIVINDYYKLFRESKVFRAYFETAYTIEKKTEDELFKNYKKSLREDIKRGERHGLFFKELEIQHLPEFYKIYTHTVKKHRSEIIPFSLIENIYKYTKNKGFSNFYGVFLDDELLSGVIVVYPDEKTALALIQGTSDKGYKLEASSFIFHNIIKKEFEKGKEIFSFGSNPKDKGNLIFFKRKFGAIDYTYPVYIWYNPWYTEV